MAHGLLCVKCGHQETVHLHPEYLAPGAKTCDEFEDGIVHSADCPRRGCAGNCEKTMQAQDWAATLAAHHAENTLAFVRNRKGNLSLVVLDMGT